MNFSMLPLLHTGKSISVAVKQALLENRLRDAAELLMREYGLSCVEVSHLLDLSAC